MFNVTEDEEYPETIQDISTTDPLLGGADGELTQASKRLASRTKWLKARIAEMQEELNALDSLGIDGGTY